MKKDFFAYYSDNLAYIRKIGQEFAREFPKTASHLDLSSIECQDPFVERLLEGKPHAETAQRNMQRILGCHLP